MNRLKKIRRNIFLLFLFEIGFNSLSITIPFIIPFWNSNGVDIFEVHLLQGIFALAIVLLEVPSGYLADILGRRLVLQFVAVLECLAVLLYAIGSSFTEFLIAELVFAFAFSLISGAKEAILYDSLLELRVSGKYQKILGKIKMISFLACAFGTLIGGFIGVIDARLAMFCAFLVTLPLIPISFLLVEPKRKVLEVNHGHLKEVIEIARECFVNQKDLAWILVYAGVIVAFIRAAFWSYEPYMSEEEIPIVYYGAIFMCLNLVASLSSHYAHRIYKAIGEQGFNILVFIITLFSYLIMGSSITFFAFPFIMQQIVRGIMHIGFSDSINRHVDSSIRATALSLSSFIASIIYAVIVVLMGALHNSIGINLTYLLSGSLLLVLAGYMLLSQVRKQVALNISKA